MQRSIRARWKIEGHQQESQMRPLERPPCPDCGMAMITIARSEDREGHEHRVFECLRCGLVETTTDILDRQQELRRRA